MPTEFDLIELENKIKLEKYYNGRSMRHYIQLLEIAETILRSPNVSEKAKAATRTNIEHYRRMIVGIVMKPFNPDESMEYSMAEKVFAFNVSRLGKLLEAKNEDFEIQK